MSSPDSADEELVVERRGGVVILRLNRPQARNALTPSLMSGIGAQLLKAEADPAARAIVLTGTGDRAFCAGLDLRAFAAGEQNEGDAADFQGVQPAHHGEARIPVIGAANATAVAGGFELLLGCDWS